jgi:hypothetical protein
MPPVSCRSSTVSTVGFPFEGPRDLDRDQAVPWNGRTQFKRQIVEQSPLTDRGHDLAIVEQRSKLGDVTVGAG